MCVVKMRFKTDHARDKKGEGPAVAAAEVKR